jgi:autotransporter-associated beta strand protein
MKYRNMSKKFIAAASVAAIAVLSASRSTSAGTTTWDGGGPDDNWLTPTNWSADVTPAPLDALVFAGTTRLAPFNNFAAGTRFGGITFDAAAGTFTVGGNALSLVQLGHIVNNGTVNLQTLSMPITLAAGEHLITGNTGGLALTGGLNRATGSVARFSGTVSAPGLSNNAFGMIGTWATYGADYAAVNGSGQVVAYTNFTELGTNPATPLANSPGVNIRWSQGTVGGDGAGTLNLNAGLTDLNTFSAPINNTQTVVFTPTSTLRFGAQGGILKGANPSGLGLSFGPFGQDGVGTITAGGADNQDGELFLNSAFGSITVRPVIADNGAGKVRVISAVGRLGQSGANALNGHNTYTGGTYVISGDFSASERDSFGTGSVEVANGARAVANPVNATTVADATYTNDFYIQGFGTPGASGLNEGALRVSRLADIAGTIHLLADSQITFRFANATQGASISGKITGDAALALGDSGANTLFSLKNANNDWTGDTNLLRGTLTIGGSGEVIPNGIGKGNFNMMAPVGTVNLNGLTETVNALNDSGNELDIHTIKSTSGPATLRVGDNNANGSFGGSIIDGGAAVSVTKIGAGEQRLFGNNTYSGTTTVQGGRLVLGKDDIRDAWDPVLNRGGADVKGGRLVFDYNDDGSTIASQVKSILTAGFQQTPKFSTGPIRTSNTIDSIHTLGWIKDVANSEVRVAYTYYGDADLNGRVNFDDYVRIDNGFNNHLLDWENGDFNYSGGIDFDDYVLIDLAFNSQSGTLGRALSFLDGSDSSLKGMQSGALRTVQEHLQEFGSAYASGFLAAVPEPCSPIIGAVAVFASSRLRRRERRMAKR